MSGEFYEEDRWIKNILKSIKAAVEGGGTENLESLITIVDTVVDAISARVGANTDAAGTATVFARLRQIVDSYLAEGTYGLAALKGLIDTVDAVADAIKADTDNLKVMGDAVWVDPVLGVPGTEFPIGTPQQPVSNLADARTICAARKLKRLHLSGNLALDANMQGYTFIGDGEHVGSQDGTILSLNNKNILDSIFINLYIYGATPSGQKASFINCVINSPSLSNGSYICGGLINQLSILGLDAAETVIYGACFRNEAVLFLSDAAAKCAVYLTGCHGSVHLIAMTNAASLVRIDADNMYVRVGAGCTGGTVSLYGSARLLDQSAGATVNNNTIGAANVTTGIYSHVNGVGEQDALIFAAAKREIEVRFDMNNLTQNTTIREYEQMDGAIYREISAKVYPTDFDAGCKAVAIRFAQAGAAYKVTFQSTIAEGADRNVPYRYMTKDLN